MDQESEQLSELNTLESLLGDIERAMAEEGSADEQRKMELGRLRELCIIKRKEITVAKP